MGTMAPLYDNIREGGPEGIRRPNEVQNATYSTFKQVIINFAGAHADYNMNADECGASELRYYNASGGAANCVLPAANPGKWYIVYNNSGQAVTLKVTGQSGVSVANGKRAILVCEATTIARVTADT